MLISRRFIEDISGVKGIDDDLRLPLYEALERGYESFDEFMAFCRENILNILDEHRALKDALMELLQSIPEEKIMVVELGYMGTIPMMLKALDDRVDFRMFTTAPFLYETYKEKIYCKRYEEIRNFETLYSQDLLMKYNSFKEGEFFVKLSKDDEVLKGALSEMSYFL